MDKLEQRKDSSSNDKTQANRRTIREDELLAYFASVQTNLFVLFVLTDDSSVCINAAQEEPHFVDTCTQRSFQKKWKECNTTETSTSSCDI